MKIVAVDIGGTAIKSGLWDGSKLTDKKEWETQAALGGAHLMERVKQLIRTYQEFDAIGISTAGEVNTDDGSIIYANSNIPEYTGMPVKKSWKRNFMCPQQWKMMSMLQHSENFGRVRDMVIKIFCV